MSWVHAPPAYSKLSVTERLADLDWEDLKLTPEEALGIAGETDPAKVPEVLTPGAAEAIAVKAYRLSRTKGLEALEALEACLEGDQVPEPADVMAFQIGLAVREPTDLEFVPSRLRPPPASIPAPLVP